MVLVVSGDSEHSEGKVKPPEEGYLGLPLLHVPIHYISRADEHVGLRGLNYIQNALKAALLNNPPQMNIGYMGYPQAVDPSRQLVGVHCNMDRTHRERLHPTVAAGRQGKNHGKDRSHARGRKEIGEAGGHQHVQNTDDQTQNIEKQESSEQKKEEGQTEIDHI